MIGSTSSVLTRNAGLEGSWSCHRCSCYPMSGAGMCGRRRWRTTAPDQQPPRRRPGQVQRAGRRRLLLLPRHRPAVLPRPRWIGRAPAHRVRRRRCPPGELRSHAELRQRFLLRGEEFRRGLGGALFLRHQAQRHGWLDCRHRERREEKGSPAGRPCVRRRLPQCHA